MTKRSFFLPLAVGVVSTCAWGQQYTISLFAGNGTAGFTGDGGAATSAQLSSPDGIAFDSSGNLYIADAANERIRKISGGNISTVAGDGTAGYSGDTMAATSAELSGPSGVALDSSGNLYIADTGNHVIRMVSTSGTITTIAGTNTGGYAGDGGAATSAELDLPASVAVDSSGNIYIADSGNNVIREISGGNINTILGAGVGSATLDDPESIALDGKGNLYVCDSNGLRVLKFALTTNTVTPVAGNGNIGFSGDFGPAVDAALDDPSAIALDASGNLYIVDTNNNRIRKVYSDGTIVTIAGYGLPGYSGNGGPATHALLSAPHGVVVDGSGNVYVADTENDVIRLLTPVKPSITTGGIVNAASYAAPVSPGSLATIFGTNFAGTSVSGGASLPLPTSLGGVSVTVNGKAAPILYINATQINFQIPWETATGSASVVVNSSGYQSAAATVSVLAAAPGLFFQGSHAIVQNSDFSLNSSGNPAKVGGTIIAYLTGGGAVNPPVADGVAAGSNPPSAVVSNVVATIGSQPATVTFAGLAPDFVGLWQANITVPSSITQAGDYALVVSAGGEASNSANVSVTP
ncbi:MAG TPA: IPT/TIG domain-containing protein [Bryobacteraceae bacterium]|nr:IPT/TIG domain-containing protein [Bryobacteraceae bacterium]